MTHSTTCADQQPSSQPRSTGKERDSESGNDYFGARYYSSVMGRWLSPDYGAGPVPYASFTNPQSLNLYAYVGNNPVSGADADGHACEFNYQDTHCGAESLMTDFQASLRGSFYSQFIAAFLQDGEDAVDGALESAQSDGLKPATDASEIEEEEPWQCPGCINVRKGEKGKLPDRIADTFAWYKPVKLKEDIDLYRKWGGPAKITGKDGTFYSLFPTDGMPEDLYRDQFSLPPTVELNGAHGYC